MNHDSQSLVFKDLRVTVPSKHTLQFEGAIQPGERVVLQGPSGCGKTTFLRVLAGLMTPSAGELFLGTRRLTGLPPQSLRAGLVFQSGALFPFLSVLDNVLFGLRLVAPYKNWSPALQEQRAIQSLERVGLSQFEKRDVSKLSGGERQRVALVRTLVCDPDYILLDEPLSAVDPERRSEVQNWILDLLAQRPVPTLIVTHDRDEAERLGTRVVTLKENHWCLKF